MINYSLNQDYLSNEECKKYARQIMLDQLGISGQQKLKRAKILVIGAGGLGCPAILYLASSGIGCLGIIDNDIISDSNLHRQILYTQKNISHLKTLSVEERIKAINPRCKVNLYSYKLTEKNAYQLITKYDLILDTSDNTVTRYLIDDACYKLHKVHIYGAIQNFEGHISVFNYQSGSRYSDLYPKKFQNIENNCNNIGVLGTVTGIIGILQATEAIKIIIGIRSILSDYLLIYNSINTSFKKIKINTRHIPINLNKTNNKYKIKLYNPNIIYKNNLKNKLKDIQVSKLIIIDVRQEIEFNKHHIPNAINIPLKNIKTKKNLELIKRLNKQGHLVIYCSNNSRAIIASIILQQYNINHYRLKNGLEEWIL
uniref:Probable molybdopterin-synthase adenylyltransferase n=1 Tax=Eucheuma denticulatum TaxID=305493 RepID=A0A8E7PGA4_9FLOR|nr:molybdopterin biosynthesis protein [Eucheuma denticulatum]